MEKEHSQEVDIRKTMSLFQSALNWFKDLVLLIWPIAFYFLDAGFDTILAIQYYRDGDWWYFSLTLALVVIPAVIISVLSFINYYERWKLKLSVEKTGDKYNLKDKLIIDSKRRFLFRFIFTLLTISPVARPIDVFCYGLQYKKAIRKEEDEKTSGENGDKTIRRSEIYRKAQEAETNQRIFFQLLESFMENAPQIVLQMYILARNISMEEYLEVTLEVGLETASIISSLLRLALTLTVFKKTESIKSWVLFPAHFLGIGSRVMILSFFAALTNEEWGIWIVILIHCLLMALIFRPQKYDMEAAKEITWMRKFFLALALVFTQVFTYLPFKREPSTRWRYAVVYYSICFAENSLLLILWTVAVYENPPPYWLLIVIGQPIFFFVSLCLLFYYFKFVENFDDKSKQPVYFGSAQLSVTFTYSSILKQAELTDLCVKENLDSNSIQRLDELAKDKEIDLNNQSDELNRTPLLLICTSNQSDSLCQCVESLLENHTIDVNIRDNNNSNALTVLCKHYRRTKLFYLAQVLIRRKINVAIQETDGGWSPLLYLCAFTVTKPEEFEFQNSSTLKDLMRVLIDSDAKVLEAVNWKGDTALTLLCRYHKSRNLIKIIRLFINRGIQSTETKWKEIVNSKNREGNNALHALCKFNNNNEKFTDLVCLLKGPGGVDINAKNGQGFNALLILLSAQDLVKDLMSKIEILIAQGVDIGAKTNSGKTAIDLLFDNCIERQDFINIFRLLVGKQVYENPRDGDRRNTLLRLCKFSHLVDDWTKILPRLIQSDKIDVNATGKNGQNILHYLLCNVKRCELFWIELLINSGLELNTVDAVGCNALHSLCKDYKGDNLFDIAHILISGGVLVDSRDNYDHSALHFLCKYYSGNNLSKIVDLLIISGISVLATGEGGRNALHFLCKNYQGQDLIETAKLLIQNGIDPNEKGRDGFTCLQLLCANYKGNNLVNLLNFFVGIGSRVEDKGADGCGALHLLCRYYQSDNLDKIAKFLIEKGVDPDLKENCGRTALHFLCENYSGENLADIASLLISQMSDPNVKDNAGCNAIHYLSRNYNNQSMLKAFEVLVRNGTDLSVRDQWQRNALHVLCEYYNYDNLFDIVRLFISSGIQVNAANIEGKNALHLLIENYKGNNLLNIISFLIKNKINVTASCEDGRNALHLLCENSANRENLEKIASFLINSGLNVNSVTNHEANALHLLVRYCNGLNLVNMVRYLIKIGIDVGAKDKSENDPLSLLTRNPNLHQEAAIRLIEDQMKQMQYRT